MATSPCALVARRYLVALPGRKRCAQNWTHSMHFPGCRTASTLALYLKSSKSVTRRLLIDLNLEYMVLAVPVSGILYPLVNPPVGPLPWYGMGPAGGWANWCT